MKVCSICKVSKDTFAYYANKSRPDGLQTYCKDCAKTRSKHRYKEFSPKKREEIKSLAVEKRLRNRQFLWDVLKSKFCVDCKENDPIVLEFDHVKENKIDCLSSMVNQAVGIEKIKKEIEKCEVRCANCHRRKTAKQFGWYKNIVL